MSDERKTTSRNEERPGRPALKEARLFAPAVLDQGVWSLAGFIASALVARFLGAEGLGFFAIGTALLYGLGGVVNSLILDPAGVIGPRDHEDELHAYGGQVVVAAGAIGVIATLAGLVVLGVGDSELTDVVGISLVVSLPVYVAWASRRLPYLTERPRLALMGSVVYVVVVIASILILNNRDALTTSTAVMSLGLGGLAQSVTVLSLWRPSNPMRARRIVREHWDFGRWFLAAEVASWMTNYGLAVITAAFIDLTAAGAFRAGQVLLRPYGIVFVGIGLAYLPRLSRLVRDEEFRRAGQLVQRVGIGLSSVATLVLILLIFAGDPVMELIFGPEFAEYGWLAALLSAGMILHGWNAAYSMGLQANNRPQDTFYGQAASAAASLIAGLSLGAIWGLAGFAVASLIAAVARFAVVRIRYGRLQSVTP